MPQTGDNREVAQEGPNTASDESLTDQTMEEIQTATQINIEDPNSQEDQSRTSDELNSTKPVQKEIIISCSDVDSCLSSSFSQSDRSFCYSDDGHQRRKYGKFVPEISKKRERKTKEQV